MNVAISEKMKDVIKELETWKRVEFFIRKNTVTLLVYRNKYDYDILYDAINICNTMGVKQTAEFIKNIYEARGVYTENEGSYITHVADKKERTLVDALEKYANKDIYLFYGYLMVKGEQFSLDDMGWLEVNDDGILEFNNHIGQWLLNLETGEMKQTD